MSDTDDLLMLARATNTVTPKPSEMEKELGVGSVLPTQSYLEFVTGHALEAGKAFASNNSTIPLDHLITMRRSDGQARALLRVLTLPIRHALREAEFVAPSYLPEGTSTDKEVEFANQMFTLPPNHGGMTVPVGKFIRQVLLSVLEGFAAFEEVRYVPDVGPLKGKVVLKKMAHRDGRTIRFLVDEKGGFDGFKQIARRPDGEVIEATIPRDKAWYFATMEEENPFYGVSYFEAAYWHHTVKKRLYYITNIAAQFAAVPGRIGTVPRGASAGDVDRFLKGLRDFAFNTAMAKPEGFTVDNFNGNSNFDFTKLIDHHNMAMAKSVLATFLEQESRQVLIDNTSRDSAADLLIMAIESLMEEIAENITHYLMPKYIDWNFGTEVYPVFKFPPLADSSRDVIKDLLSVVATAQSTQLTPEMIREMEKKMVMRLGLEVDYDEVEEREAEEKAKAEEQEALMNAQMAPQPPPGEQAAPPPGEAGAAPQEGAESAPAAPPGLSPERQQALGLSAVAGSGVVITLDEVMAEMERMQRDPHYIPAAR